MKSLIDIPDKIIPDLSALCAAENISRAEAVRRAIEHYVTLRKEKNRAEELAGAFGAWKGSGTDGLEIQRTLRGEWKNRDTGF